MPIGSLYAEPIALGLGKIVRFLSNTPQKLSPAPGNGATAQVTSVTFSSVSNSSVYTVRVTDPYSFQYDDVSITTDSSATDAEASALLAAAWLLKPIANSLFSAADAGAGVVNLTARTGNLAITVAAQANPGTHMAIAQVTAPAAATEYTFGKAVELYWASGVRKARIPVQPTRGTFVLNITHDASAQYIVNPNIQNVATGEIATLATVFSSGANVTATGAAAVVAVNANNTLGTGLISASAATPSGATVAVTVTLPTGWTFVSAPNGVATAGTAAISVAAGTAGGTVPDMGLVFDAGDDSSDTLGTGSRTTVRGGTVVPVFIRGGALLVNPAAAPSADQFVLVDFAATGGLTPTASVTTAPLISGGSRWRFTGESQVVGSSTYYVAEAI